MPKPRDTCKYDFIGDRRTIHNSITKDLERRGREHRPTVAPTSGGPVVALPRMLRASGRRARDRASAA
jgi:hypothetical protein